MNPELVSPAPAPPPPSPSPPPPDSEGAATGVTDTSAAITSDGLDGGSIAGIVTGAVALVVLVGGAFVLQRRAKKFRAPSSTVTIDVSPDPKERADKVEPAAKLPQPMSPDAYV